MLFGKAEILVSTDGLTEIDGSKFTYSGESIEYVRSLPRRGMENNKVFPFTAEANTWII